MNPLKWLSSLSSDRLAASAGAEMTSLRGLHSLEHFVWLLNRPTRGTVPDLVVSPPVDVSGDGVLIDRIRNTYRVSSSLFKSSTSFWDKEFFKLKKDIHEAFIGNDRSAVERILRTPGQNTLFWGFDALAKAPEELIEPHELVLRRLNHTADWRKLYALWILDGLHNLAEALGARRAMYPEVAPPEVDQFFGKAPTPDQILTEIEHVLGMKLQFPNPFPGELGLPTSRGIVGFRSVQAVYQAWLISKIANKRPDFKVMEIGAGLGRTAYFASQFGLPNYTIIDIPLTNAAQAYILGRTLGDDLIQLYGESSVAPVKIVPASALSEHERELDLIVNIDSWPEMAPGTAMRYWNFAKANARAFLSINHEISSSTIRSLCAGDAVVDVARHPYWMRRGYVEELITFGRQRRADEPAITRSPS